MKRDAKQAAWSRRYLSVLRNHLKLGPNSSLDAAQALGRQAVTIQLETLDVARIHERALLSIAQNAHSPKPELIKQAKAFFFEVLVPIEKTHRTVLKTRHLVKNATEKLRLRTKESSAATRLLQRGVARRKASEALLKKSSQHLALLLRESSRLQKRLQKQTHKKLSHQENVRQHTSLQLQDEIAQTLLAINLRLLTLKMSVKASEERLKKEITETHVLVKKSVKTIQRLAHEIDQYHEA